MANFVEFDLSDSHNITGSRKRVFVNVDLIRTVEHDRSGDCTQIVFDAQHYVSVSAKLEEVIEAVQNC